MYRIMHNKVDELLEIIRFRKERNQSFPPCSNSDRKKTSRIFEESIKNYKKTSKISNSQLEGLKHYLVSRFYLPQYPHVSVPQQPPYNMMPPPPHQMMPMMVTNGVPNTSNGSPVYYKFPDY